MVPDPIAYEAVGDFQQNNILFHADEAQRFDPGGKMLGIQILFKLSKCLVPKSIHGSIKLKVLSGVFAWFV
jgi:hypothetical protein